MIKYIEPQELQKRLQKLSADGKKIGLSHGVFDLVHPGHIQHFIAAKKMVDCLIVSITADQLNTYAQRGIEGRSDVRTDYTFGEATGLKYPLERGNEKHDYIAFSIFETPELMERPIPIKELEREVNSCFMSTAVA